MQTDTPLDHPAKELKADALENISDRFSIIESIIISTLGVLWVALMIVPFLEIRLAAIVSLFVGALAVASSIAAKPVIENFIAGVIITFNKPFRIGDTVIIDEHYGTIEDITTTHTILKIWDWRRFVIPNAQMINKDFINYTLNDSYIWRKVAFQVAYDADLALVKRVSIEVAQQSQYSEPYEDPSFWVMSLRENHYKCWVAAWSNGPANAWELGNDIRSGLIIAFQKEGIKAHSYYIEPFQQIEAD